MQREIAASLVVSAVHYAQPTLFFLRDAGHLRLVGIESCQRILGRAFAGDLMKVLDKLPNLRRGSMPLQISPPPHALRKTEPQFQSRNRVPPPPPFHALFLSPS